MATTKKVETTVEVKEEVKVEAKKAPAKKTVAKAEPKKATTVKKEVKAETAKTEVKKAAPKKATAKKVNKVLVQFAGMEFDAAVIEKAVKADYTAKNGKKTMTSVEIYIKPEDMKAYYVIDGIIGDIAL